MEIPFQLRDAFKTETEDQDKILSPAETVRRFRERLEKTGLKILDEAVRIDTGRLDIPVYVSACGEDALAVMPTKKQMGKGANPEQAEASAVMELAERFSLFSFRANAENFKNAAMADLDPAKTMAFEEIAASVHDTSPDLDAARRLFASLPLQWVRGWDLTRERPVWLPFDWFYAINEFNGSSAGNCKEEALCQGICEVVERHVSCLVSRERLAVPGIAQNTPDDPVVREMLAKYKGAGVDLWLSDFTLDTGVPTVGVMAWDPSTFPARSEIVWTAGTAPNPQKALSRALTETAQLAGDFNTDANYVASGLPKFKNIAETAFITRPERIVAVQDLPDLSHPNIRVEVERLIAALAERRRNTYIVDITNPRIEVPAFYTVVPGAHFRERAENGSVGMFCARLIADKNPAPLAILELQRMSETLPGKYYVEFQLGAAYLEMGDAETARVHLDKALALDPPEQDAPTILVYLASVFKASERYVDALAVLEKAATIDPERTDLHNLMGFCHFKLKDHETAIRHFQEVLRLDPSSAIDYANIAVNYREMGRTEEAIAFFERALSMDPSIDFARESLKRLKTGN